MTLSRRSGVSAVSLLKNTFRSLIKVHITYKHKNITS